MYFSIWSKTLLYFLFFFFSIEAISQYSFFNFHHLTIEQNLSSQDFNYYIFKDSKGFVWISSINGLNRFDGNEVRQYHHISQDTHSLADENIHSHFFEDEDSGIWFSTNHAIHRYDRKIDHFERHYLPEDEDRSEYQLMHLDTVRKGLWVRNQTRLYYYEYSNRRSRLIGTFSFNHRSRMFRRKNAEGVYLMIPDSLGLRLIQFRQLQIERDQVLNLNPEKKDFFVSYLYYEDDEHLWLAADTGLIEVNIIKDSFMIHRKTESGVIGGLLDIVSLEENSLLIVSSKEDGIHYFDKEQNRFIKPFYQERDEGSERLLHPVYRMYLDEDQTLWMHLAGRGLYFTNLQKRKFKTFLQASRGESKSLNHIKDIAVDQDNRIWCLSRNGIVVLDQTGMELKRFLKFDDKSLPLAGKEPFSLYCDRKGRVWLGTQSGLFVLRHWEDTFKKVPTFTKPEKPGISFITALSDGRLLVSSLSEGIMEMDEENWRLKSFSQLETSREMYTWIFEFRQEKIFFYKGAAQLEIYDYHHNQLSYDTSLVFKDRITAFVEDSTRQLLWISSHSGLYKIDLTLTDYQFQKDTIFNNGSLNGMLMDEEGRLWISSNKGLYQYNPDTGIIMSYDRSDGLQSLEYNFWSFVKTSDGKFAFGGVNGLNLFDPLKIQAFEISANPEITRILINDSPPPFLYRYTQNNINNASEIKRLILPYDSSTISFNFAALEYSHPAANEFKFIMHNLDDTIVYHQTKNFIRYPNIPPGNYIFQLWASNSDGIWSEQIKELEIIIQPPWWQTSWARLSGMLILSLIIYSIYNYRIIQIRKRESFLRKEAEYKQMIAETETAILRLQMNPHFIFNSLNSISSYILQEETDKAYDYLVYFSSLMRMILNFAEKPLIALSDEIDLLERYIKTESLRFVKEIHFEVQVTNEINADEVYIPTMLLQPFIENSIIHGLAPKKELGTIKLKILKREQQLYFILQDNGVGRQAAKRNPRKYASKAIGITRRRLALLEAKTGGKSSFEITDLYNSRRESSGTKVELILPLIE